ncbi:MAG: hypothetical protein FJZ10_01005 [Candidatus Omnitrophica bacterium]|nr:hypothetical protein [Candidatus Omnitrophota bacterium]
MPNNKEARNCWDYWQCPKHKKESCTVYGLDMGSQCFNVFDDYRPQAQRGFEYCFDCPWFKMRQASA